MEWRPATIEEVRHIAKNDLRDCSPEQVPYLRSIESSRV
jgi:hypothetical protein